MNRLRPPALARWIVRLLVPPGLREEIEGDLLERWRDRRRAGGSRAAAGWYWSQVVRLRPLALRRAAKLRSRYGNETGGVEMKTSGAQDLPTTVRHAIRSLRRRPLAALTVTLTIGLAVGATTAVFSVVNGVLLRPLPYPDADGIVRLWQTKEDWRDSPSSQLRAFADRLPLSVPTFGDWLDQSRELGSLGVYAFRTRTWRNPEGAEAVQTVIATSGVFDALGMDPVLGRHLVTRDDALGATPVAVLSHGAWEDRFAGDRDVIGRTIPLGSVSYTVVGVMPPQFQFPASDVEVWTSFLDEEKQEDRDSQFLGAVGRIRDGGSIETVRAELIAIQEGLAELHPDEQENQLARVQTLLDATVGDSRATLWFLLAAVGLVLLIASANIAGMLSALATARSREMAVRAALGAGRGDLARGRLVEGGILALLGGLLGVALLAGLMPTLVSLLPSSVPRLEDVRLDTGVLLFSLGITAVVTLLVGVAPALQASGARPGTVLNESSRGVAGGGRSGRVRVGLVVLETALAFLLMVGAGLLGKSFYKLWTVDRGFSVESVAYLSIVPDPDRFPEAQDRARFRTELRSRLAEIPGASFSAANQIPLSGSVNSTTVHVDQGGDQEVEASVLFSAVLDDYFQVLEIPLVAGRGFGPADGPEGPQVAIVSRAMADRFWPDGNALGGRFRNDADDPWVTVVGIVGDVRHQGLGTDVEPQAYLPAAQTERVLSQWVVRAVGDMGSVLSLAREKVREVSPDTPVRDTEILTERIATSVSLPRFRTVFVLGLAGMSCLLALLGIYGLVAFTVGERRREIGVRMALGATSSTVLGGVVGISARLALVGMVLGVGMSVVASRVIESFLYEVEASDPWILIASGLLLLSVSVGAGWFPARQAASVNPVAVLSAE